jgi:hypothetical protein
MGLVIIYGLGGYCTDCTPDHDHPLHNIVEEIETPDEVIE